MRAFQLFCILPVALVAGHARWECPLPRDVNDVDGQHVPFANTGNKHGPCGPFSGKENWGRGPITTLKPGLQTLTWVESISHAGSPFRIAILDEEEEAKVILLNHIPHWDESKPTPGKEETYTKYRMTVNIPDVACDKCSLQLLYVMTDKTTRCTNSTKACDLYMDDTECSGHLDTAPKCKGASSDVPCKRPNTCFSSYWSCASVVLKGSTPIAQARVAQPKDWPFSSMRNMSFGVENGSWSNGWIIVPNVPKAYTFIRRCIYLRPDQDELEMLLNHQSLKGRHVPIIFFANKMDLPGSMSEVECMDALELEKIQGPWHIAASNALTGEGIDEGIEWLAERLTGGGSSSSK